MMQCEGHTATVTGGASTMSRQPGHRPTVETLIPRAVSARGCTMTVQGTDGRTQVIVDWPMGQHGPIFGYNPPFWNDALHKALNQCQGTVASYAPPVEDEVAGLLGRIFPAIDEVRFGKTGSDVCAAAVRLARAVTGRDAIAAYGYHGNDLEFAHAPQNRGAPQAGQDLVRWFEWGFPDVIDAAKGAAAIIVEVPPVDDRLETTLFLKQCREVADREGALLILDEVVTGFRLDLRGASGFYRVQPDLTCWGKAMANGFAVSALGGRHDLMKEFQNGVFFSGTFFDDPLGLTAAKVTLEKLIDLEKEVYPYIWTIGQEFKLGFNNIAQEYRVAARCVGQAPRTVLEFDDPEQRMRFNQACLRRGVLFDHPQFSTMAHTPKVVTQSLTVVEQVFREWANGRPG